jgi:rhodanese-related sulfurtransferase
MQPDEYPLEITVSEAKRLLESTDAPATLIDVREPWETQLCRLDRALLIPMQQIPESLCTLSSDRRLLIMCHHGGRSLSVTKYLRAQGRLAASNIAGGIDAWSDQIDPTVLRY